MGQQMLPIRRSPYRNWYPIDNRYEYYTWPKQISARCRACEGLVLFSPQEKQGFEQISPGVYQVRKLPTSASINGRGVCSGCKKIVEHIDWPAEAFYAIKLAAGDAWAWNKAYLQVLRQHVSGEQRSDAAWAKEDALLLYYLARLPKYVVLKRNRPTLLRKIDAFLSARNG